MYHVKFFVHHQVQKKYIALYALYDWVMQLQLINKTIQSLMLHATGI